MSVQEEMLSNVEEQSQIVKAGLYLSKMCSHKYDLAELLTVAKYLLYEQDCSIDDILNGKVDETIIQNLRLFLMHRQSVRPKKEDNKPIMLSAKKEHISPILVKKMLLGISAVSLVAGVIFSGMRIHDIKQAAEISKYIGTVAYNDQDFSGSVVKNQTYHVPNTTNTFAYDNISIAQDIVNVCGNRPELFHTCLLDTYSNMNFNRLSNMDAVIAELKSISSQDISLLWMYSELQSCRVFLDFVLKNVDFEPNSEEVRILRQDIDNYAQIYAKNKVQVYDNLNSDSQKRIQDLITKYMTNRKDSYKENYSELQDLANEVGKRGG